MTLQTFSNKQFIIKWLVIDDVQFRILFEFKVQGVRALTMTKENVVLSVCQLYSHVHDKLFMSNNLLMYCVLRSNIKPLYSASDSTAELFCSIFAEPPVKQFSWQIETPCHGF